jgi:hypothetical protein
MIVEDWDVIDSLDLLEISEKLLLIRFNYIDGSTLTAILLLSCSLMLGALFAHEFHCHYLTDLRI